MVKGKNRGNTFRDGWGTFPPTPPPMPDLGVAGSGSLLGGARVGLSEGRKGGWGRRGWHGPRTLALSRQCMWRYRLGHVSIALVHHWLGTPAWRPCRANACGATEATRRASGHGATKWAMLHK